MAAAPAQFHEFAITLYADGQQWPAQAIARDARRLRARLAVEANADVPIWPEDTTVSYAPTRAPHDAAHARVTRQVGTTVWLELQSLRAPLLQVVSGSSKSAGFAVAYTIDGETRIAYANRLAASGLTIRTPNPIDRSATLSVRFVPPGERASTVVNAVALSGRTGGEDSFWTRVKFTRLPVEVGKLLAEVAAAR